ncbi:MAG: hypothetical protein M1838_005921 [Thelocarpon superellum]|nr:MAG: hypothetical protein M1838_005921 [Thelocarpon superellum]
MFSWLRARLTRLVVTSPGTTYPSSPNDSPDMMSPLYPDRQIRPLPKRRIRSRLSPDVADTILYPPTPSTSTPLFFFPQPYGQGSRSSDTPDGQASPGAYRSPREHGRATDGPVDEVDSEEEEVAARTNRTSQGPTGHPMRESRHAAPGGEHARPPRLHTVYDKPPPPNSTTSSADGYDSFENANNKKKRKIPTPGSASIHHAHLSAELANMGISSSNDTGPPSPDDTSAGVGKYYGTGNAVPTPSTSTSTSTSALGLSGAGRGRFARPSARTGVVRSPLGVSSDGSNAWASGRGARQRPRDWAVTTVNGAAQTPDQGIISTAIANAVERDPRTPPKGQENISLLQQAGSKHSTPTNTQFTFTSAANVAWPGDGGGSTNSATLAASSVTMSAGTPSHGHFSRDMATQGTQTSPDMPGATPSASGPGTVRHAAPRPPPGQYGTEQAPAPLPPKKAHRRTGKELALAARQRRLQQEYKNYHHPPSRDDIWICEFCEYESIFGGPPEALMRQYEVKDLRERRRAAEKRRLLEKAKLKGRRGKKGKGGKNAAAATASATATAPGAPAAGTQDVTQVQSQGTQSDEFLEDEFEDEAVLTNAPQAPVRGLNVANKAAHGPSHAHAHAYTHPVNGTSKGRELPPL